MRVDCSRVRPSRLSTPTNCKLVKTTRSNLIASLIKVAYRAEDSHSIVKACKKTMPTHFTYKMAIVKVFSPVQSPTMQCITICALSKTRLKTSSSNWGVTTERRSIPKPNRDPTQGPTQRSPRRTHLSSAEGAQPRQSIFSPTTKENLVAITSL